VNPFIEFYQNPIGFLSALGYALLLATLVFLTLAACWSNAATIRAQYQANHARWGYLPPATWVLRIAAIPFILGVDAWALGALIWLLAP